MQVDNVVTPGSDRERPPGGASHELSPWSTRVIAVPLSLLGELGVALVCAAVSVSIRYALDPWLGQQNVYTIAFAATAAAALIGGWRAGLVCALLAQLSSNVLFVIPRGSLSFSPEDTAQAVTFYLMTLVLLGVTHVAVKAHRALRSLVLRLRQADQAKSELLATIAHELRNPLSAMRLAADRFQLDEQRSGREKSVAIMNRQLVHVSRLVDDLTDASLIHNGKVSLHVGLHRITDLLNRASELIEPLLKQHRQTLMIDCPDQAEVMADGARMVQVLANVLHNASKYSPDHSTIRVAVEFRARQVCIEVIDEGIGIPHEKLEWVFDSYAQVKEGSDGLGLGLSLVRKLLELHGGTIQALSRGAGKGSVFEICLPRVLRDGASPE